MDWQPLQNATLPAILATCKCWAHDGYVTLVAEFTWHLVAFHTPPHASLGTRIGQMATDTVFSALHPLQITDEGKLRFCNNTVLVMWFHAAGKLLNTLDR